MRDGGAVNIVGHTPLPGTSGAVQPSAPAPAAVRRRPAPVLRFRGEPHLMLSDLAIRRPVLAAVVSLLIIVFGSAR